MHSKYRFNFHLIIIVLWIAAFSLPPAASLAQPIAQQNYRPAAGTYAANIGGFHLVSADEGWLLLDADLYWTKDGGAGWQKITPPADGGESIQAVTFLNNQQGWAVLLGVDSQGLPVYQLAQTVDGGTSWQMIPLSLFAPQDGAAQSEAVYLDFIDPDTGWMMVKQATGSAFSLGTLFKTVDGGLTWARLSAPTGDAVYFATANVGWIAGGPAGDQLYGTQDGGATWSPLSLPGLADGTHLYQLPVFTGPQESLIPVVTNGAASSQIDFYATQDGGQTWEPTASSPLDQPLMPGTKPVLSMLGGSNWILIEPAHSEIVRSENSRQSTTPVTPDPLLSGIVELDMATPAVGWALYSAGDCQPTPPIGGSSQPQLSCTNGAGLLKTTDGGRSWTLLTLPQAALGLAQSSNPQIVTGQGFDTCAVPPVSSLQAWMDHSPYRIYNLYIGGSALAGCGKMTAEYISELTRQSWKYIVTWAGPQASCFPYSPRMSSDPTTAYNQGVSEADAAVNTAASLLLTLADKTGVMIYYDLEGYDVSNTTCRAAAKSFMAGWAAELQASGNLAGVYGSGYSSALSDFATNPKVPNGIWAASWNKTQYNNDVTVWDIPYISNTLWANHQRLRQYAGGHNETWGGITFDIDCTLADGLAIDLGDGPLAQFTSPVANTWLSSPILVTVAPVDPGTVISRVDFEWHSSDWAHSDWVDLGSDTNGSDGWSILFDPRPLADQQGAALFANVFDASGKRSGVGNWNLGIDRSPPPAISVTTAPMYTNAPFRDFHVRWSGTDGLSGVASYDIQFKDSASGVWTDLVNGSSDTQFNFVGTNGHTYYFRGRARDAAGNVGVYSTNEVKYTVATCSLAADAYDLGIGDNTPAAAAWIPTDGTVQHHNFNTEGDQDWVKFLATPNSLYTLKTGNTGGHSDTVLYLYGMDGFTQLATNDDYTGLNLASRIDWSSTTVGIYYVKVVHYDIYAAGCTTQYDLSVTRTNNYVWSHQLFYPFIFP